MSRFYVGQRVRIVRSYYPEMIGRECVLTGVAREIYIDRHTKEAGRETNLKHPTDSWGANYVAGESQIEPILSTPTWEEINAMQGLPEWNCPLPELVHVRAGV